MMYNEMPTRVRWEADLGLNAGIFTRPKLPHSVASLSKLIEEFESAQFTASADRKKLWLLYYMVRHCDFALKNAKRPDKLGGSLGPKQFGCVQALRDLVYPIVCKAIGTNDARFDWDAAKFFGRTVNEFNQTKDASFIALGAMHYYTQDIDRAPMKLSFRGGKAYRWTFSGSVKGQLVLYDTEKFGDALENGASLYVMDARGRLYVTGKFDPGMELKHSSIMGGMPVLMAGTIRFVAGQLIWISGRSGHYQPTVSQMVTLLERLRDYQIDLRDVTVYRQNERGSFPGSPSSEFEPCSALDLLAGGAWPTGVEPGAMMVFPV